MDSIMTTVHLLGSVFRRCTATTAVPPALLSNISLRFENLHSVCHMVTHSDLECFEPVMNERMNE